MQARRQRPLLDSGLAAASMTSTSGVARSVRLFRAFRKEQSDPEFFYSQLAQDAVDQVARHCELGQRIVLDIGGGAGEFTAAFRSRGALCYLFEPDRAEMLSRGTPPAGAVLADGYWLPVSDGAADVCFSSNVLEHVPDPEGFLEEMIRVTKPDGLIYLSFTNWYSPWGGHEMSPWHYLGAGFAERRYARRQGRKPKHHVDGNLFRVHIGPTLAMIRARTDVCVVEALPRYYPRWCRPLLLVPVLREVTAWNLLVIMRRIA